ncbi:MAG TPA: hypothetical protein PLB73_03130, partial [Leptospiraceae bacterium]|nr:hypothetical protein [Leptospiraceae bacterium]
LIHPGDELLILNIGRNFHFPKSPFYRSGTTRARAGLKISDWKQAVFSPVAFESEKSDSGRGESATCHGQNDAPAGAASSSGARRGALAIEIKLSA